MLNKNFTLKNVRW